MISENTAGTANWIGFRKKVNVVWCHLQNKIAPVRLYKLFSARGRPLGHTLRRTDRYVLWCRTL